MLFKGSPDATFIWIWQVLLQYDFTLQYFCRQVRETAISCVIQLYTRNDLQSIIEEYALFFLSFLRLLKPPDVLFGPDKGRPDHSEQWTEEAIRACLYLYLVLLPLKHDLIHE